jgi:hypothetical protein
MRAKCLQVEEHDNRESAWFVYENKVYDGTRFLNDHPGGPESILIVAGQVSCCLCSKLVGLPFLLTAKFSGT